MGLLTPSPFEKVDYSVVLIRMRHVLNVTFPTDVQVGRPDDDVANGEAGVSDPVLFIMGEKLYVVVTLVHSSNRTSGELRAYPQRGILSVTGFPLSVNCHNGWVMNAQFR